jgi:hypothetical protein
LPEGGIKGAHSGEMSPKLKINEIGYWSPVKLSILEEYAKP